MLNLVADDHASRIGVAIWQDIASIVEAGRLDERVLNGPRSLLLTVQGVRDRKQGICIWACYPYCISDKTQRDEAAQLVKLLLKRCIMENDERDQLLSLQKTLEGDDDERQLSDGG